METLAPAVMVFVGLCVGVQGLRLASHVGKLWGDALGYIMLVGGAWLATLAAQQLLPA